MDINIEQAATIVFPLVGFIGWMWNRLDKKFETILTEIKEIRQSMTNVQVQLGKLETRVEERTLKVVHVQKNGTEKN